MWCTDAPPAGFFAAAAGFFAAAAGFFAAGPAVLDVFDPDVFGDGDFGDGVFDPGLTDEIGLAVDDRLDALDADVAGDGVAGFAGTATRRFFGVAIGVASSTGNGAGATGTCRTGTAQPGGRQAAGGAGATFKAGTTVRGGSDMRRNGAVTAVGTGCAGARTTGPPSAIDIPDTDLAPTRSPIATGRGCASLPTTATGRSLRTTRATCSRIEAKAGSKSSAIAVMPMTIATAPLGDHSRK